MKRWMNSSQTSGGVPSHALIILCEGKHDYEFIKELISKINVKCDVKDQVPGIRTSLLGMSWMANGFLTFLSSLRVVRIGLMVMLGS